MKFNDEEINYIKGICKLVVNKKISVLNASDFLKRAYGFEYCAFSLDGKAILRHISGEEIRFGGLVKNNEINMRRRAR